ncbi:hypothetical protein LTR10_002691 [Elasticomyces elasticus]|nr:hypothetical protein LTR10_002691 [Elasticomyces elasticus]KAK4967967.1 hypothetical protein LTR42_010295 [Elasticomyces elasticus]
MTSAQRGPTQSATSPPALSTLELPTKQRRVCMSLQATMFPNASEYDIFGSTRFALFRTILMIGQPKLPVWLTYMKVLISSLQRRAARTSFHGFLDFNRPTPQVRKMKVRDPTGDEIPVHIRGPFHGWAPPDECYDRMGKGGDPSPRSWQRESAPLRSRAWSYQEHRLATHLVQFGSEEMIWECARARCCECERMRCFGNHLSKPDHPDDMEWLYVVQEYAGRSLTRLDDKLAALQGVAARFEHPDLGRYCYGIWEKANIDGLAWYATDAPGHFLSSHAVLQLGPSWSWISTYGSIDLTLAEGSFKRRELSEPPARIWDIASMQPEVDSRRAILYPPPPKVSWLLQLGGKVATGRVRHERTLDSCSKIYFGQLPLATTYEVLTSDESLLIQRTKAFDFYPDVDLSGKGAAATAALTLAKHVQDGQVATCVLSKRAGARGISVWIAMVLKPAQDRLGVYMRVGIADGYPSHPPEIMDDPWDDAPIRIIDIE